MVERVRGILDESEVPTVEGLADNIASLETESPEFVIVPPAVLISFDNIKPNLDNMNFVVNVNYEATFVLLILVEQLPDRTTAYSSGLQIGQDIIDGLLYRLPDNVISISNIELSFAFAGDGFVGLELRIDTKIKN